MMSYHRIMASACRCRGLHGSASAPTSLRPAQRRGIVLVLVLVVIALLTLAAFTFTDMMLTERKAAVLTGQQAQARALVDSGVEMTRLFLMEDRETQDQLGGWYDNPERFQAVPIVGDDSGEPIGRFAIVAPVVVDGRVEGIRFGLEDESARLNLNTLLLADTYQENGGRQLLMGLPGMTEAIADAILDWIDPDDEAREFGAEAEYYSALEPAYAPKNGPLETVEELLLVRDVTPWLLFGTDANRNGWIDAGEPSAESIGEGDNADGSLDRGWAPYLTLYSVERNLNPDGEPKIDLNQDDMEELYNQLTAVFDDSWATFIIAYRQNGKYTGSKPGERGAAYEPDLSKGGNTKLTTVLDLIGAKVQVQIGEGDDQEEVVLKSPFSELPGAMNFYLPTLLDQVAVNTSPLIPGRININQAPRVVLEGIPGLEPDKVDAILAERVPNPVEADDGRRYETWIMADNIVTLAEMKALIPFVCGSGAVYRAQVIGYYDRGGPSVRIEAMLDTTEQPTRLRFYRDLSHLGRGYPLETLGIAAPEWE